MVHIKKKILKKFHEESLLVRALGLNDIKVALRTFNTG